MPLLQTRQVSASAVPVAPSLRIRKAAVADAAESPERKTAGGVESVAPMRGQKA
jgi:hypothetical protein